MCFAVNSAVSCCIRSGASFYNWISIIFSFCVATVIRRKNMEFGLDWLSGFPTIVLVAKTIFIVRVVS